MGLDSSDGDSPEVDGQLTGQGHDGFLARGYRGFPILEQGSPAAHSPVARLKASYPPGHFDHQAAQARIAMLADRPQPSSLVAGAFPRAEPKVVAHLAAVAETPRIDQLARQQLVGELALPKDQLARSRRSQLGFDFGSLLLDRLDDRLPTLQLPVDPRRHRLDYPGPAQLRPPASAHRHLPVQ